MPVALVVSNGLNSRSRTNSGVMPRPVSRDFDRQRARSSREPDRDTLPAVGRGIDGVLHQVSDHVLEPVLVAERRNVRVELELDRRVAARPWRADAAHDGRELDEPRRCRPASRPSRNCSISCSSVRRRARRSSACRAGIPGLSRWRSAFLSISDSCATRFLRSWTTNADIRLNASNLRASSSASVARICPR